MERCQAESRQAPVADFDSRLMALVIQALSGYSAFIPFWDLQAFVNTDLETICWVVDRKLSCIPEYNGFMGLVYFQIQVVYNRLQISDAQRR